MKIAIISMIREPWGGSEELWFSMAKAAIAEGHTIIHLSFDFDTVHPRLQELEALGARLYQRPGYFPAGISTWKRSTKLLLNYIRKKIDNPFKQVFRHRPDIVLYNGTCYSIAKEKLLLGALRKYRPIFFIMCQLNVEDDREISEAEASLIRSAYDMAKNVFLVSRRNQLIAERHLCRDMINAVLVRNPVNMQDTESLAFPSFKGNVQMALVGNLITRHKGQDILFSLLKEPKWKERNWDLNIYGDGPDRGYLEELARYYRLQDRIIFHGRVNDVRGVWKKNHLLLMPSHMEGMPLAIVEAMLCGRPCVATDVGGAAEWIVEGVSGFLADAATARALDTAMEKAWQEKDHWEAIGIRAHERALTLYDPAAGKTLLKKLTTL
jgi:glycosyltransferase involved in cell wall biosynthesis